MKVVIDHREPEIFRTLFADGGDSVSVARLEQGDFLVNGQWLFERKTIHDLGISLVDGRLFRQALALVKSESHPVIVLEGGSHGIDSRVSRESVQGALVTLGVFFGLPVLRSLNPAETVRTMRYTAEQAVRFSKGAVHRFGYRPRGRRARQLYVLQGLPGIGEKRAESLLKHFGGIEAVMCAAADDLAEVDGIGLSTAQAIRCLVRG
ncbi:MAG: ERCC4 domain-containing protein [Verrucomicrobiota bacterium]